MIIAGLVFWLVLMIIKPFTSSHLRLFFVNLFMIIAIIFSVAGLAMILINPGEYSYIGWLVAGFCYSLAMLITGRNIKKDIATARPSFNSRKKK